jgi:excisionase family DNA binding protein
MASTTTERPEFLTPRELAAYLRVSIRTSYQLCYDDAVPAVKVGGVWRIPRAELDAQLGRSPEMREAGFPASEPRADADVDEEATASA